MYRWKQTIGDPSSTAPRSNIWGYEATHGVGYHEYLACAKTSAPNRSSSSIAACRTRNVPMDKMDELVQDALTPSSTPTARWTAVWGGLRAKARPSRAVQPEIHRDRQRKRRPGLSRTLAAVLQAIKAHYPDMHLIANHWGGGYPTDAPCPRSWTSITTTTPSSSCTRPIRMTTTTATARRSSSANTPSPPAAASATCAAPSAKPRS